MSNIYNFYTGRKELDVDEFLEKAKNTFTECMVIGWDRDGDPAFGATGMDLRDVMLLTEIVKRKMLDNLENDDG
mgnify:CR=1 FL=1